MSLLKNCRLTPVPDSVFKKASAVKRILQELDKLPISELSKLKKYGDTKEVVANSLYDRAKNLDTVITLLLKDGFTFTMPLADPIEWKILKQARAVGEYRPANK